MEHGAVAEMIVRMNRRGCVIGKRHMKRAIVTANARNQRIRVRIGSCRCDCR